MRDVDPLADTLKILVEAFEAKLDACLVKEQLRLTGNKFSMIVLRLRDGQIFAVTPRPEYAPLFAYSVLSQNVVGGHCSS